MKRNAWGVASMIVWRWARRALRALLLTLAAVVLLIEEWGWRPLAAWVGRLAAWPPWARLEARIGGATPKLALALFLVPAVLLIPVKLVALWFIHQGHTLFGVGVIVAAKLIGTALVGRLFTITQPQLMQFDRFARVLWWWRATKLRVRAAVRRLFHWPSMKQRVINAVRRLFR